MFEKYLWKSDILRKIPGFYISETLVEYGLKYLFLFR